MVVALLLEELKQVSAWNFSEFFILICNSKGDADSWQLKLS